MVARDCSPSGPIGRVPSRSTSPKVATTAARATGGAPCTTSRSSCWSRAPSRSPPCAGGAGWPAPLVLVAVGDRRLVPAGGPAVRGRAGAAAGVRAPAAAVLGRAVLLLPRLPGVAELDHPARRRPRARQRAGRRAGVLVARAARAVRGRARARRGRRAARRGGRRGRRPPAGPAASRDDAAVRREPDQRRDVADALQGRARRASPRARGRSPTGWRPSRSPSSPAWRSAWRSAGWCTGPAAPRRPRRRVRDRAAHPVRRVLVWRRRCAARACSPSSPPGLYLGHTSPRAGYATRLYEEPIWSTRRPRCWSRSRSRSSACSCRGSCATSSRPTRALRHGIAVSLAVLLAALLIRPVYIFATARFDHLRLRGCHRPTTTRCPPASPPSSRGPGMRGVVTLAAAAAIPVTIDGEPFPDRATMQLAAYTVAIGTLLLQGLTLPWVITRLGVGSADEIADDAAQEAAVRVATADAVQRRARAAAGRTGPQRPRAGARGAGDRPALGVWRARAAAAAVMLDPATPTATARRRAAPSAGHGLDPRAARDGGSRRPRRACARSGSGARSSPRSARCSWSGATRASSTRRSCGG